MVRRGKEANQETDSQSEFLETPVEGGDWIEETEEQDVEGQLAVDVYQTKEAIVIKAPIAGVTKADIDISVLDGVVTIRGERRDEKEVEEDHYFVQECYWGAFSRSVILPTATDDEHAAAALEHGVLTITIPKSQQEKVRKIKIN